MNVITDYGTFLREAKSAVVELTELEHQEERLAKQLKQDQKALDTEKKMQEDKISQTTIPGNVVLLKYGFNLETDSPVVIS